MSNVNSIQILGNLGDEPSLRHTGSGQAVCNLRVATNKTYKDKEGETQQSTEWHRVVVWGKTAENCKKYLSKGRQVFVEGRMQYRKYDKVEDHKDESGNDVKVKITRTVGELVANNVQFLGGSSKGDSSEAPPTDVPKQKQDDTDVPF